MQASALFPRLNSLPSLGSELSPLGTSLRTPGCSCNKHGRRDFLTSLHPGDTGRPGNIWRQLGADTVHNRWVQTLACHMELGAAFGPALWPEEKPGAQPLEEAHLWPAGSRGLGLCRCSRCGLSRECGGEVRYHPPVLVLNWTLCLLFFGVVGGQVGPRGSNGPGIPCVADRTLSQREAGRRAQFRMSAQPILWSPQVEAQVGGDAAPAALGGPGGQCSCWEVASSLPGTVLRHSDSGELGAKQQTPQTLCAGGTALPLPPCRPVRVCTVPEPGLAGQQAPPVSTGLSATAQRFSLSFPDSLTPRPRCLQGEHTFIISLRFAQPAPSLPL